MLITENIEITQIYGDLYYLLIFYKYKTVLKIKYIQSLSVMEKKSSTFMSEKNHIYLPP